MIRDAYQELMAPHGGRLQHENVLDPSAWAQFCIIKSLLSFWLEQDKRQCVREGAWRNSPISIEFDLLASLDINAIAAANVEVDGIGINAGLVAYVENAFYAILTMDTFFPLVGSAKDNTPAKDVALSIMNCDVRQGWGQLSPRDVARRRTAFILSRLAESFVLFHEVSHICYGHLLHSSLRTSSGPSCLLEYDYASAGKSDRILQAMEFDADEGGVAGSLGIAICLYDQWELAGKLLGAYAPPMLAPREVIYHWVVSVSILFRVLDLFSQSAKFELTSSHPPPGPRTDHAVYCGREWVRTRFPQYIDLFQEAADSAIADVTAAWETLALPALTHAVSARERYAFAQSLRDEMLRLDKDVLDGLLSKKGDMTEKHYKPK